MGCHERELSILFTDDAHMALLNERYLHRTGPTNVLAFPMLDGESPWFESQIMGDVVISLDTARREAASQEESLEETVSRLLVHGILHLLDFDHDRSAKEALRMEEEQERLLALIGETPAK